MRQFIDSLLQVPKLSVMASDTESMHTIRFDSQPVLYLDYNSWTTFLSFTRWWAYFFFTKWSKAYYENCLNQFCKKHGISPYVFPWRIGRAKIDTLDFILVYPTLPTAEVWKLGEQYPGLYGRLLERQGDFYQGYALHWKTGHFSHLDYKYLGFTFQHFYNFSWFVAKVYILNKFCFQQEETQYGVLLPRTLGPIYPSLIYFVYQNQKNYKLRVSSRMVVHLLYFGLILWNKLNFWLQIAPKKFLFVYVGQNLRLRYQSLMSKLPSWLLNLWKVLPFTLILYLKYNLWFDWAGKILLLYIVFRLSKIAFLYSMHIAQTFYIAGWANYKFKHYTLIPLLLSINIGIISLINQGLILLDPNLRFLTIAIFVILKALFLDQSINGLLQAIYSKYYEQKFSSPLPDFIQAEYFNLVTPPRNSPK